MREFKCYYPVLFSTLMLMSVWLTSNMTHIKIITIGYHKKRVRLRTWNFHGYWRNSMQNFQGLILKEVQFPVVNRKNLREFSGALLFCLNICKECNTIVQDFRGSIFFLSGTIKSKERKKKHLEITWKFQGIPKFFQKSMSSSIIPSPITPVMRLVFLLE